MDSFLNNLIATITGFFVTFTTPVSLPEKKIEETVINSFNAREDSPASTTISKLLNSVVEKNKNEKNNKTTSNTTGEAGYSFQDLINMSGPLPEKFVLGDKKYTTNSPKKGYVYLCNARSDEGIGGAQQSGPWIRNGFWYRQEKISIDGEVSWKNATFKEVVSGLKRILTGNGLPISHTSGTFPVARSDDAYKYDKNPNSIKTQTLNQTFPVNPTFSTSPNCMGGEVGIMLTGVPLFNAFDATLRDAVAYEVQDDCDGHPQVTGQYHYHSQSSCFKDESVDTVLGYALDGFPITGGQVSDGKYLLTEDLDICHGLTSEINIDGKKKNMYHYVLTADFPYSVSCFRGKPVSMQVMKNSGMFGGMLNRDENTQREQQNNQGGASTPPQEAITSCVNKTENSTCSVTTPNGSLTGNCHTTPDGKYFACIPQR